MSQTISANKSRGYVMAIIGAGFLGALIALFASARDGAISDPNQLDALVKIIGFYLPLITIIGTFYFKDKFGGTDSQISKPAFIFAALIILTWVLIPVLLLSFKQYIESILNWIDKINSLCVSFINLTIAYIFSMDKPDPKAEAGEA